MKLSHPSEWTHATDEREIAGDSKCFLFNKQVGSDTRRHANLLDSLAIKQVVAQPKSC